MGERPMSPARAGRLRELEAEKRQLENQLEFLKVRFGKVFERVDALKGNLQKRVDNDLPLIRCTEVLRRLAVVEEFRLDMGETEHSRLGVAGVQEVLDTTREDDTNG